MRVFHGAHQDREHAHADQEQRHRARLRRLAEFHATELYQLALGQVDGHGPLAGLLVIGGFGVQAEGGVALVGKRQERLAKRAADIGAVLVARERPYVIGRQPVGPAAVLLQEHRGRPGSPPVTATAKPARSPASNTMRSRLSSPCLVSASRPKRTTL